MSRPQLAEFVKRRLSEGVPLAEIEAHLRRQGWEEPVIAEALSAAGAAPTTRPAPSPPKKRRRARIFLWIVLTLLAIILAAAGVGGYLAYGEYSAAKEVREKLKFVGISGKVTGQFEPQNPAAPSPAAPFELLAFSGVTDSSQLSRPRASFHFTFGANGEALDALRPLGAATDARFVGTSLLTLGTAGKFFGGAEVRFVDGNGYVLCDRTPLTGAGNNPAIAVASALLGPTPLTGAWLRIPMDDNGTVGKPTEIQVIAGLLLRPTDAILGQSAEVHFTGKSRGDDMAGNRTEVQHYAIDGAWLTAQLVAALRDSQIEEKMLGIAMVQKFLTGGNVANATGSLETLQVSDAQMDVWVGERDRLPYKAVLTFALREGKELPATLHLRAEMDLSYGKSVPIEAPASSVSLQEMQDKLGALESLIGGFK